MKKLDKEQKKAVKELMELVMYLARSGIPPDGIIVEPISTNVDRVKDLKQKLGLDEPEESGLCEAETDEGEGDE